MANKSTVTPQFLLNLAHPGARSVDVREIRVDEEGLEAAWTAGHLAREGEGHCIWEWSVVFFEPHITFFGGGIVAEPAVGIVFIDAMPMEVVARLIDFLFEGGEDVSRDEAIKLTVAEMVGEIEDNTLCVESMDGFPQESGDIFFVKRFRAREFEFRFEPHTYRENGGAFPGEHGSEKLVFGFDRHASQAEEVERLIDERFEFVSKSGIEEEFVHVISDWVEVMRHCSRLLCERRRNE